MTKSVSCGAADYINAYANDVGPANNNLLRSSAEAHQDLILRAARMSYRAGNEIRYRSTTRITGTSGKDLNATRRRFVQMITGNARLRISRPVRPASLLDLRPMINGS